MPRSIVEVGGRARKGLGRLKEGMMTDDQKLSVHHLSLLDQDEKGREG